MNSNITDDFPIDGIGLVGIDIRKKPRKKLFGSNGFGSTRRKRREDAELQMRFMSGTVQKDSAFKLQQQEQQNQNQQQQHQQNQQQQKQQNPVMKDNSSSNHSSSSRLSHDRFQDAGKMAILREQGFSTGLATALADANRSAFAQRFWIIDNSASMDLGDGHRIWKDPNTGKLTPQQVTRWEEIQDTVYYHCEMAAVLESPTHFQLLNPPGPGIKQHFTVAHSKNKPNTNYNNNITNNNNHRAPQQPNRIKGRRMEDDNNNNNNNSISSSVDVQLRNARTILQRARPAGYTPLTSHINSVRSKIAALTPVLQQTGKRVVVILATDGLPTDKEGYGSDHVDQDFIEAIKGLVNDLPVWLVIRLSTDEENVCKFYNSLDSKLEIGLEVLDDFAGEAKEVRRHNPWLNYCLAIHRSRELGYHHRIFDFLDERALTKGELQEFVSVLLGVERRLIPDPNQEWNEFLSFIQRKLHLEDDQFNPVKKRKGPLLDIKMMHKIYGNGRSGPNNCAVM